ncbi:tRNA-i(6)A37 methylthiotransferase [Rubellimicrobium mesophilum DSM 19309]|uniref:tRNA-i(6)A37 methylthiotransferase n=1 Tax=Rubellimicrobium mesophilum DSM 19309 TaxID=442562 RepID=A0A017HB94_9RHOB|nr:tRNA-i(6)A37 methylthiotransferase [Rubellimicrobium mesophilum DSM 19309]
MPKLFVKTYGCQMNVHDGERMAELLAGQGYEATDKAEEADMVLLNTCHIREKAAEKVYSDIGRLKPLRAARPDLKIAVAGCVAQAEGEEILARAPMVDLVVGPQSYHTLPKLMERVARGEKVVETEFPPEDKFAHLPARRTKAPTAFLTVQEGCDKFCAFCVVLHARRRGQPACRADRGRGAGAGGAGGEGDHAARPERQRLARGRRGPRGAGGGAGGDRGAGAHPLHDLAPERHGRGPDRGTLPGAEAHALPAPAGAVWVGSGAQGDEPQAQGRGLPASRRAAARGATGPRPVVGLHRGVPGRDGRRFRGDAGSRGGGPLRRRLFLRLLLPARDPCGRAARRGPGGRPRAAPAPPGGDRPAAAGGAGGDGGPRGPGALREAGADAGADERQVRAPDGGQRHGTRFASWADRSRARHGGADELPGGRAGLTAGAGPADEAAIRASISGVRSPSASPTGARPCWPSCRPDG